MIIKLTHENTEWIVKGYDSILFKWMKIFCKGFSSGGLLLTKATLFLNKLNVRSGHDGIFNFYNIWGFEV